MNQVAVPKVILQNWELQIQQIYEAVEAGRYDEALLNLGGLEVVLHRASLGEIPPCL